MRLKECIAGAFILGLLSSGPAHGLQLPASVIHVNAALGGFGRPKTVTVNVRNDSREVVELRSGENVMKLEPGKTVAMKLPVGSRVLFERATATHVPGDVLFNAATSLSDSTVVIH